MLTLICFLTSIGQLATVIYLPSMPFIAQSLHSTAAVTELTLTLFMLAFALSQLIYGPVSDLYGRRNIIMMAMLVYIVGSVLSALAPSMNVFLLARFIEGFGAGGITALARASSNDIFSGHALTKALTYTSISASLASMLSPTAGGFIQKYLDWRINFWVLTAYAAIFLCLTFLFFPRIKPQLPQKVHFFKHFYHRYKEVLLHRHYLTYTFCAAFSYAIITIYYVASPFLYEHQLQIAPNHYGMLFLITSGSYIIGGFFTNYFPISEYARLWLGIILLILATGLLLLLGYLHYFNVVAVVLPMALAMFAVCLVFTTSMTCAARLFKHIAGTAAALLGCLQILVSAIFTAIMAHLHQQTQIPMGWLLVMLSLLVLLIVYFGIHRTTKEIKA